MDIPVQFKTLGPHLVFQKGPERQALLRMRHPSPHRRPLPNDLAQRLFPEHAPANSHQTEEAPSAEAFAIWRKRQEAQRRIGVSKNSISIKTHFAAAPCDFVASSRCRTPMPRVSPPIQALIVIGALERGSPQSGGDWISGALSTGSADVILVPTP